MKITKNYLKQVIKEELKRLNEQEQAIREGLEWSISDLSDPFVKINFKLAPKPNFYSGFYNMFTQEVILDQNQQGFTAIKKTSSGEEETRIHFAFKNASQEFAKNALTLHNNTKNKQQFIIPIMQAYFKFQK
jgi:hypothetical protein